MPTVHRLTGGQRVVIYPNDHRPAHVHVIGGGCEAVFELNCPGGPPTLRESYGFAARELNAIVRALQDLLAQLCNAWSSIHGTP